MLPIQDEIKTRILASYPDAQVKLTDLTGTLDHWEALIITPAFEGQRLIVRQQGVYKALGDLMSGPVHAFTMQTLTPEQAQKRGV
jgi:stress-induced morphogen